MESAAAHEKRWGDDERQRHLERELGALAGLALHLDFAVEGAEIRADHVEADAAAGEFGFHGGGGKAGVEKLFAQVAFGEAIRGFVRNEAAIDGTLLDTGIVNATAVVFDFDVDVVAAVIGTEGDLALLGFARGGADMREFDAVRDGIADEVNERIGDLLDDVVVEFGIAAGEVEFDELLRRFGGIANRAREQGIERADGHHTGGGDFVLQMVRELGEFVDVAFDAVNVVFQLCEDFVDIGGNFGHGTRKDVEVVVAIHFEFAELLEIRAFAGGGAGEHFLRLLAGPRRGDLRANAIEFVFFLEFVDFAMQALFREAQGVNQLFEFADATNHLGAADDQLADSVHHAVEAAEGDADGFVGGGLLGGERLLVSGFFGHGFRGNFLVPFVEVGERCFFFHFLRSQRCDFAEQGIDALAHFGFVGPLAMKRFLEDVHRFQADVHDRWRRMQFTVAQTTDEIFDAVRDAAKTLEADLGGRTFDGVNGAEEPVDVFRIVVAFEREQAVTDDLQVLFGFGLEE